MININNNNKNNYNSSSPGDRLFGELSPFFPLRNNLNKIQQKVAPILLDSTESVLISAPTNSGKTLLLECAIANLFRPKLLAWLNKMKNQNVNNNNNDDDFSNNNNNNSNPQQRVRAVYLCPLRALASEKFQRWSNLFGHALTVAIETGDQSLQSSTNSNSNSNSNNTHSENVLNNNNTPSYQDADLIVSTPERWDAITRRWTHAAMIDFVASVQLLLIDEVHSVGEKRGEVLEVIVSRMRTVHREIVLNGPRVRGRLLPVNNHQQQQQHPKNAKKSKKVKNEFERNLIMYDDEYFDDEEEGEGGDDDDESEGELNDENNQVQNSANHHLRFVAASGTIPNPHDLGEWLCCPPQNVFIFSENDRPIPLTVHVQSVPGYFGVFQGEKVLNDRILQVIKQFNSSKNINNTNNINSNSPEKTTMIFCISRQVAASTATFLAHNLPNTSTTFHNSNANSFVDTASTSSTSSTSASSLLHQRLHRAAAAAADHTLKQTLPRRVAFHHAGLSPADRRIVEDLVLDNASIVALCTTTTLSVGVNLPARLVILKGISKYSTASNAVASGSNTAAIFGNQNQNNNNNNNNNNNDQNFPQGQNGTKTITGRKSTSTSMNLVDMTLIEAKQMCGRAGRAGFDTEGIAVILTQPNKEKQFQCLATNHINNNSNNNNNNNIQFSNNSIPPLESQLHLKMETHLNAEIVLGTIESLDTARAWLQTTFLWIRLVRKKRQEEQVVATTAMRLGMTNNNNNYKQRNYNNNSNNNNSELNDAVLALTIQMISKLMSCDCCIIPSLPVVMRVLSSHSSSSSFNNRVNDGNGNNNNDNNRSQKQLTLLQQQKPYQYCGAFEFLEHEIMKDLLLANNSSSSSTTSGNNNLISMMIYPTAAGKVMSKYYLSLETMMTMNKELGWPAARSLSLYVNNEIGTQVRNNNNNLNNQTFSCSIPSILRVLCKSAELQECCRIRGDKQFLTQEHKKIKFPLSSSYVSKNNNDASANNETDAILLNSNNNIQDPWQKAFILTQLTLSEIPISSSKNDIDNANNNNSANPTHNLHNFFLVSQINNALNELWNLLPRFANALCELCVTCINGKTNYNNNNYNNNNNQQPVNYFVRGHGDLLLKATILRKCIEHRLWYDGARLTRQLPKVGDALSRMLLAKGGFNNILDVVLASSPSSNNNNNKEEDENNNNNNNNNNANSSSVDATALARRIETMCGRNAPFGSLLLRNAHSVPRLKPKLIVDVKIVEGEEEKIKNNNFNIPSSGEFYYYVNLDCKILLLPPPSVSSSKNKGNPDFHSTFFLFVTTSHNNNNNIENNQPVQQVNNKRKNNKNNKQNISSNTNNDDDEEHQPLFRDQHQILFSRRVKFVGDRWMEQAEEMNLDSTCNKFSFDAKITSSSFFEISLKAWLVHEDLLGVESKDVWNYRHENNKCGNNLMKANKNVMLFNEDSCVNLKNNNNAKSKSSTCNNNNNNNSKETAKHHPQNQLVQVTLFDSSLKFNREKQERKKQPNPPSKNNSELSLLSCDEKKCQQEQTISNNQDDDDDEILSHLEQNIPQQQQLNDCHNELNDSTTSIDEAINDNNNKNDAADFSLKIPVAKKTVKFIDVDDDDDDDKIQENDNSTNGNIPIISSFHNSMGNNANNNIVGAAVVASSKPTASSFVQQFLAKHTPVKPNNIDDQNAVVPSSSRIRQRRQNEFANDEDVDALNSSRKKTSTHEEHHHLDNHVNPRQHLFEFDSPEPQRPPPPRNQDDDDDNNNTKDDKNSFGNCHFQQQQEPFSVINRIKNLSQYSNNQKIKNENSKTMNRNNEGGSRFSVSSVDSSTTTNNPKNSNNSKLGVCNFENFLDSVRFKPTQNGSSASMLSSSNKNNRVSNFSQQHQQRANNTNNNNQLVDDDVLSSLMESQEQQQQQQQQTQNFNSSNNRDFPSPLFLGSNNNNAQTQYRYNRSTLNNNNNNISMNQNNTAMNFMNSFSRNNNNNNNSTFGSSFSMREFC